jgi:BTB/POZ domain
MMMDLSGDGIAPNTNIQGLNTTAPVAHVQQANQQFSNASEATIAAAATATSLGERGTANDGLAQVGPASTPATPQQPAQLPYNVIMDEVLLLFRNTCLGLTKNLESTLNDNVASSYVDTFQSTFESRIEEIFDKFSSGGNSGSQTGPGGVLASGNVPKFRPTGPPRALLNAANLHSDQPLAPRFVLNHGTMMIDPVTYVHVPRTFYIKIGCLTKDSLWGSSTTDFLIVCDKMRLRVHQFVLSHHSGYFNNIFGAGFRVISSITVV